jgi:hypothetical protein
MRKVNNAGKGHRRAVSLARRFREGINGAEEKVRKIVKIRKLYMVEKVRRQQNELGRKDMAGCTSRLPTSAYADGMQAMFQVDEASNCNMSGHFLLPKAQIDRLWLKGCGNVRRAEGKK